MSRGESSRPIFPTFDDATPRTVEIVITVGDKDTVLLHGLRLAPAEAALKQ
jgi:hypothetical protein